MKSLVTILIAATVSSLAAYMAYAASLPELAMVVRKVRTEMPHDYELTDLLERPDFQALQRKAPQYLNDGLAFLGANSSYEEKRIVIYAFQALPEDDYVAFLNQCLTLAEKGHLEVELLKESFIPGEEWSDILQVNHHDPQVKALLDRARKSKVFSADDKVWFLVISSERTPK